MKMAKLQKATLDPSKISGYCGRLKCCLRYEDHTYRDLNKRLPKRRCRVKTSQGEGIVIDGQILTQLVSIRADDGTIFAVPVEEVEILLLPDGRPYNKSMAQNQPNCPCGGDNDNDDDHDTAQDNVPQQDNEQNNMEQ
jgi:hypothetical protein